MTTEEFEALPVEARLWISENAGCLGCGGNKENKLAKAYQNYLQMKNKELYRIFGGGVNYKLNGKGGVLYHLEEGDSDFEISEKLKIAEKIHAKNPELFLSFDKQEIENVFKTLKLKVVSLDEKPLKKYKVKPEEPEAETEETKKD